MSENKELEFEYEVKVIPVDDNLLTEVSKMVAEGWQMANGIKPVAIYHVVRAKVRPTVPVMGGGLVGKLVIDDSKVRILRADGTLE